MISVRNNTVLSRYELVEQESNATGGEGGETVVGIADYRIDGDQIVFPHTEIDTSRRGRGLGAVLIGGALNDVRGSGRRVVPQCWFVAEYLELHPEYADLQ